MYFHELKEAEFEYILDLFPYLTCREFAGLFSQPEWCEYPDAVSPLGCWSLTGFMVTGEEYCKGCECKKRGEA